MEDGCSVLRVRKIRENEGLRLRVIRLEALRDAPLSFGTTLAEAEALPEAEWHGRAERSAAGETQATFVAEERDEWLGMATGIRSASTAGSIGLVGVWVRPTSRGAGVARHLVGSVIRWARERAASRVELWVTETNGGAIELYRRLGFRETGATQPLPHTPELMEIAMVLNLEERSDEVRGGG